MGSDGAGDTVIARRLRFFTCADEAIFSFVACLY